MIQTPLTENKNQERESKPALDKKLAQAFLRLKDDLAWRDIVDVLVAMLVDTDKQARRLDGPPLYRCQGKALTIEWLLESADDAGEIMARVMQYQSRLHRQNNNRRKPA